MAGPRRRVERVLESVIWAVNWVSSRLASDNDIEAQVDDAAGNDNVEAEHAEVWTIAGVQSRPKDGNETDGYAKALRIQMGDSILIIGTHDPRHVETCEPGELVLHALGNDGSRRCKVVLKPDGTIDIDGTEVIIGNPSGTLEKQALGDALQTWADAIRSDIVGHTHPYLMATGTGVSGSTGATTSVSGASFTAPGTLKSSKHSVES